MPEETKAYAEQVEHALMAGDTDSAEEQARGFQDLAAARITQMLESADDKERRRLNVQLGTSRALDDVQALRGILNSRDGLAMLGAQLPGHITCADRSGARERQGAAGFAARRNPICSSIRSSW